MLANLAISIGSRGDMEKTASTVASGSKLITVFGVTGNQGGSVAKALAATGFNVRGVTRNPASEKAQQMAKLGLQVVKGDLDDPSSIDAAVKGSYGVFLVTNYWEYDDEQREITQGKTAADACLRAGVKHLVYSGLPYSKDLLGRSVPNRDGKGIVEKYLDEIRIPNTSVRYPLYYEVLLKPGNILKDQGSGTNLWTVAMQGPLDAISVQDAAPAVVAVFSNPDRFIGKKIGLSADKKTPSEYMEILSRVTGKSYQANYLPPEEFAKLPFPAAYAMAAMFEMNDRFPSGCDLALTKHLSPNAKSFEEWATEMKAAFD